MNVELYLCTKGSELKGEMLLSGSESGWTVRGIIGWVQPDGSMTLQDTRIVEQGRSAGWRFCEDTQYILAPSTDGSLRGSYLSKACKDQATLVLLPQTATGPAASPPPGTSPPASMGVSP